MKPQLALAAIAALAALIAGCNDHQVKNLSSTEIAVKFAVEDRLLDPYSARWGEFVSSQDKSMVCGRVKSREADGQYTPYREFIYSMNNNLLMWEGEDDGMSVKEYCGALRLAQNS